ncbi:unnamed protein product, partial [marine sediment metagenome]
KMFNVGTGNPISIKEIAEMLSKNINPQIKPFVSNQFRPGDIRHCFADISKISQALGYSPKISFEEGIKELMEWVKLHIYRIEDKSSNAINELKEKRLLK